MHARMQATLRRVAVAARRLPAQFTSVTILSILVDSNQGDEETTKVRG